MLVELDPDAVRRPHGDDEARPLGAEDIAAHLRALADAGADEAILVLRPIDERSIGAVGAALAALDG